MQDRNHLPKGYKLQEYQIESVLGEGGFGITYLANDLKLKKKIVIKEFMPRDFASRALETYNVTPNKNKPSKIYKYFKQKFLEEAQILASITHLNIVKVIHFFETNNTAYFVMEYIEGESLKSYISSEGTLSEEKVIQIIIPILEGLKEVHKKNFLHRDIAPDNIYLSNNKMPMLIDFGAARDLNQEKSQSLATVFKKGYSAPEQYISTAKHTPATDIYAVGAVMLTMISGKIPPEAISRMYNSTLDPIKTFVMNYRGEYSQKFLDVIEKAMSVEEKNRFQNVSVLQDSLNLADKSNIKKYVEVKSKDDERKIVNFTEITEVVKKIPKKSILSKVQWSIISIVSIYLAVGFYLFIFKTTKIAKSTMVGYVTSNPGYTRAKVSYFKEHQVNPTWRTLNQLIVDAKEFNAEEFKKFFNKNENKFQALISKENDKFISDNYRIYLKKAESKYESKEYNTARTLFYNALTMLEYLTEMH